MAVMADGTSRTCSYDDIVTFTAAAHWAPQ
jgi:hypothetical protein